MIESESDLRRWLAKRGSCYWIENKQGGTQGMPDAICFSQGVMVFLELKMLGPRASFSASAQQMNCMDALRRDGAMVFVLGAWRRSGRFAIILPEQCSRIGSVGGYGSRAKYVPSGWLEFCQDDLDDWSLTDLLIQAYLER